MTNHFTYLNSGPMVKDLFFEHGKEITCLELQI